MKHFFEINGNILEALVEPDARTTVQGLEKESAVSNSTVVNHLNQVIKSKKGRKEVARELNEIT